MKLTTLFIALLLVVAMAQAEEQTFFDTQVVHGGYGAPVVKFTQINHDFGLLVGAQGGWIVNHTYGLGLGAYGLVTDQDTISVGGFQDRYGRTPHPGMAYGGVILSYIHNSDKMIHPTFDLLIGGGYVTQEYNDNVDNHHDYEDNQRQHDGFFVLEPTASVEVNLVKFMRVDAGVGYRLISGISRFGYSNSDYSGVTGTLTFKFGKF